MAAERPVAIFGRCAGFGHRGAAELCDALKNASSAAPPYLELLNTTFALVPAGESPASMRLPEVLAAGAVPVFVSGDTASASAYVRPYDEVVP